MEHAYCFYTAEGFTESPTEIEVDNFQILGFEKAESEAFALEKLLKSSPSIFDYGFTASEIQSFEIATDTTNIIF